MNSYKTIQGSSIGEYKDKGSKFIGYAIPVTTEQQIKEEQQKIRAEHPKARHHCFAFRLGFDGMLYRANDDGEPSGTGGRPILAQIDSFGVTNVLVIVVRYFGGVLLGTAGLTKAYKGAAQEALTVATIIEKEITEQYTLIFGYDLMPEIMNILKRMKLEIQQKDISESCNFTLSVPRAQEAELLNKLGTLAVTLTKA